MQNADFKFLYMYFINNGKKLTLGDGECRVQLNVAIIVICPQSLTFGRAPLPLVSTPVIVLKIQEAPRPGLDKGNQQAQGNEWGQTKPHLTVTSQSLHSHYTYSLQCKHWVLTCQHSHYKGQRAPFPPLLIGWTRAAPFLLSPGAAHKLHNASLSFWIR